MAFRLQKLPYLAFEEVLREMDIREKFILAASSKKSARSVKLCPRPPKLELNIGYDDEWALIVYPSDEKETIKTVYTSSECQKDGECLGKTVFSVLEFIADVFNKPPANLSIDEYGMKRFHKYSRFFKKINVTLKHVHIYCHPGNIQNRLETLKEVPSVYIYLEEHTNPPTPVNTGIQYHFDTIVIYTNLLENPEWHKDLLLCMIDCKAVSIKPDVYKEEYEEDDDEEQEEEEVLTIQDLTDILIKWIAGSKMECFTIDGIDVTNFADVFKSLGQVVPVRAAKFENFDGIRKMTEFEENKCFLIQQKDDGPKAIVVIDDDYVLLETDFELVQI
uniref:F-box domain-containing protein n=1 Tax=Caenorhabditis tropicalis TaxID=1561998 RepID=A0A1I7TBH1_9PELO